MSPDEARLVLDSAQRFAPEDALPRALIGIGYAVLALAEAREPKQCSWVRDDTDDPGCETWLTACGEMFRLDDGPPAANGMRFCCYCGGALVEDAAPLEAAP